MAESTSKLSLFVKQIEQQGSTKLPPVEQWNPELSGDIDIVIDRQGNWFHEGDPFQRESLVKMFASILKKEEQEYFLVSPVEKFRLQVEDLPFVVTGVEVNEADGDRILVFTTNLGDKVVAQEKNPIVVEYLAGSNEPNPKIRVRRNLEARINRNVFYELVELSNQRDIGEDQQEIYIESAGVEFVLGRY